MRKSQKRDSFKIIIYILLIVYCFSFSGCFKRSQPSVDKKTIAVSIVPQETFVKAVAGEKFNVVTMIPPGKSVENYSPSPQEMEAFSNAELYFSIGVPAENESILDKASEFNKGIKIIDMALEVGNTYPDLNFDEPLDEHIDEDDKHSHDHTGRDPHIWLSPKRVTVMIDIIQRELSLLDPDNKKLYEENAAKYKNELEELDNEIKEALSNIKDKTFLVYHPAFGYYADDYGLNMVALESEGKEATVKDLQQAIDLAKSYGVKVIFYQAEIDSKQSRTFADEIGGKAVMLEPLSPDYVNNLRKMTQAFIETTSELD